MRFRTMTAALLPLAMAPAASAQDGSLLVFDYSGFENPAYHSAYVEQHGDSPDFTFFGDEEEAFQKLVSGFRADVSHVCAGSVTKWRDSGLIEPWDTSRIDAYGDLDANLTGSDVSSGSEEIYFVPTDFGSTAIAYNTEQVPEDAVQSLDVFLNPDYAGRLTLPDNVDDAYALAYLATGTTDWQDVTDEQFEAATDWLRQAHENLRTYWIDPAELAQLLATGEVMVAWAWNETLPTMVEQGFPVGFEREPEEGSSLWLCGYVNLADGEGSEDLAYDYLNAILDPSSTQPLLDEGFGHANAAAMAEVGEEALRDVGLGQIDAPVLAQLPISNEQRERHSEAFERIKAGF
ncbi:ABC transporter substrate-binding protein [Roseitranquillus sediminis]|uniref:ABC transporter substrate-binding protein n=1 Tax=Roseitranquillus sediminis TaxID=2809051 RepID=UPI001D0C7CE1|nr:extracellular solute-binding protein [Roseitranquillus sediminis]MBM9595848.1 extracellular solute-binding protein [Roseitranquillus sediminis]